MDQQGVLNLLRNRPVNHAVAVNVRGERDHASVGAAQVIAPKNPVPRVIFVALVVV